MIQTSTLSPIFIHPSWQPFFADAVVQQQLRNISLALSTTQYTPSYPLVLRFASVDLSQVSCIWIGKDPYPQVNIATGRAFEVNGVTTWFSKTVNGSLKNIIKAIHKTHFNLLEAVSIEEVRADILSGLFPILPPNHAFTEWEERGALFLNTAFTCDIGGIAQAGSHQTLWKAFFSLLLAYIAKENPKIDYFLWGDAQKYAKALNHLGVDTSQLFTSKHPSTNGDSGGYNTSNHFLNNACFKKTNEKMHWGN